MRPARITRCATARLFRRAGAALARRMETAMAWVNRHLGLAVGFPLGGEKSSGIGQAKSILGLKAQMDAQVVQAPESDTRLRCVRPLPHGQGCITRSMFMFDAEIGGNTVAETREDIEFKSEGDIVRGWFYPAAGSAAKAPAIVMAHGFGAVKEMYLDRYAEVFAAADFAVLVFDYRRLGASDGTPRQEIEPAAQIGDYRNAITWIAAQPGVDADRIGLWGTSYSGGHVLVLAATDPRVKCAVSQVPTISGNAVAKRRFTPETLAPLLAAFHDDRKARMDGAAPQTRTLVSHDPGDRPVYATPDAVEWYLEAAERGGQWENRITLRSIEFSRGYEPGAWVKFVAPCPLLMIVAREDVVTPADLALAAYETAGEPKRLLRIDGGHFTAYGVAFEQTSSAARDWFREHLL